MFDTIFAKRDSQLITATSMVMLCFASGQRWVAFIAAVVTFGGIALAQQSRFRSAGKCLYLGGLLFIVTGMMFSLGFDMGKDMAHRDARHATASVALVPR